MFIGISIEIISLLSYNIVKNVFENNCTKLPNVMYVYLSLFQRKKKFKKKTNHRWLRIGILELTIIIIIIFFYNYIESQPMLKQLQ